MMQKLVCLLLLSMLIFTCQSNFNNVYSPNNLLGVDTYIESSCPENNFYLENNLGLLNIINSDSSFNKKRTLLKINCTSIPKKARIDSAFIYLYNFKTLNLNKNCTINIERIVEDWDVNNVNWNNQPKTNVNNGIKYNIKNQNVNYYKIDVKCFILGLVNEDFQNYGLMFKIKNSTNKKSSIFFFSSNTKDIDSRPKLRVFYNQNIF